MLSGGFSEFSLGSMLSQERSCVPNYGITGDAQREFRFHGYGSPQPTIEPPPASEGKRPWFYGVVHYGNLGSGSNGSP